MSFKDSINGIAIPTIMGLQGFQICSWLIIMGGVAKLFIEVAEASDIKAVASLGDIIYLRVYI